MIGKAVLEKKNDVKVFEPFAFEPFEPKVWPVF